MENLNLLFYKTFYAKLGQDKKTFDDDVADKGKALTSSKFYKEDYQPIDDKIAANKFLLKTAYPGLLVGTGYAHGVESESDVKVGFSFDYVTGQPYIPGSSVKGLLRSYFDHPEVIREFLDAELSDKEVKALMLDIFEENERASDNTDIFFDAIVRCGDAQGHIIGFDSITPHRDEIKSPMPIKIIKVLPDVVFEFSFNLKESVIGKDNEQKTVTAEQKENLFKEILVNFGIGAKTNVGYGVLIPVGENELNAYPQRGSVTELVKDKVYDCIVTGGNDYCVYIRIEGTGTKGYIDKRYLGSVTLKADDRIKASFLFTNKKENNCFKFGSKV